MIQKMINHVAVRFVIVGGTVAVLQLLMLFVLHSLVGVSSLFASIIAFVLSVFINFGFQKFWSFNDPSRDKMALQFGFFFTNALGNLMVNVILMAIWLGLLRLNVYVAQAITLILIAFFNFFIYKIIFNYKKNHQEASAI